MASQEHDATPYGCEACGHGLLGHGAGPACACYQPPPSSLILARWAAQSHREAQARHHALLEAWPLSREPLLPA